MEYVLITGCSTGIGYALTRMFISQDVFVFGSVRKNEDALRLKREFPRNFHPLIFDVCDHDDVRKAGTEVKSILNGKSLSCLVNNAGIALSGPLQYTPISIYRKQFDVNVFGMIAVTQVFLPMLGMGTDHPGKILNISSVSGKIAFPFLSPYAGSKFAMEGISESLRRELKPFGIQVVIIGPGVIKTPIWDKAKSYANKINEEDFGQYANMIKNLKEVFSDAEKGGMEVEVLAQKIYNIFRQKRPKLRYGIAKSWIGWIIPFYFIPRRLLDRIIIGQIARPDKSRA